MCPPADIHEISRGAWEIVWELRPYIGDFKRKMTSKDTRRVRKNAALKKHEMVKKTISKKTGKVQV